MAKDINLKKTLPDLCSGRMISPSTNFEME